jgi:hypothetical protein
MGDAFIHRRLAGVNKSAYLRPGSAASRLERMVDIAQLAPKSRPLADAFERWLRAKLALISQKGKLADAIRYALSRWKGVTRFHR